MYTYVFVSRACCTTADETPGVAGVGVAACGEPTGGGTGDGGTGGRTDGRARNVNGCEPKINRVQMIKSMFVVYGTKYKT